MKCPVCNADLPSTAKFCGGCGTTLSAPPPLPSTPQSYAQSSPVMNAAPGYSAGGYGAASYGGSAMPAVKRKYKVLRMIAVLMKILAFIAGAILIIAGLVMIVAGAASSSQSTPTFGQPGPSALFGGLVGGLILFVYGIFVFVFLYAYAEWMYVFMDIEENTRVTNEMLSARK